jgi:hypothetical protein
MFELRFPLLPAEHLRLRSAAHLLKVPLNLAADQMLQLHVYLMQGMKAGHSHFARRGDGTAPQPYDPFMHIRTLVPNSRFHNIAVSFTQEKLERVNELVDFTRTHTGDDHKNIGDVLAAASQSYLRVYEHYKHNRPLLRRDAATGIFDTMDIFVFAGPEGKLAPEPAVRRSPAAIPEGQRLG